MTTNYPNASESLAIISAITNGIIACNGQGVESELNKGSTFSFILPLASQELT